MHAEGNVFPHSELAFFQLDCGLLYLFTGFSEVLHPFKASVLFGGSLFVSGGRKVDVESDGKSQETIIDGKILAQEMSQKLTHSLFPPLTL